jgi:cysteine desulfurase/selenocysteine lyase
VERIRRDFPILSRSIRGRKLVYLDNAATTQKPQVVIDRLVRYYTEENSNVHRGVHYLSEVATADYEAARTTVKKFINARDEKEIVFTRGTTEAINLVAQSWGRVNVREGDEILITAIEHHSNIVPWQLLCEEKKARLRVAPVDDDGDIIPPTPSVRSTPSPRSSPWPTPTARSCWSTAPRAFLTCPSTCRRSTATSTRSPDTRCMPRPA